MINADLTLVLASFGIFILLLFFKVSIKQLIKRLLSGGRQRDINIIFITTLTLVFGITVFSLFSLFTTSPAPELVIEEKSELEKTIDDVRILKEAADEIIQNKKATDSVIQASKEEKLAYQFGESISKKSLAISNYQNLSSRLRNLTLLRTNRRDYRIVKYDALSRHELENSLDSIKASLQDLGILVSIIDLNQQCKAREKIQSVKSLKARREKVEIPMIACK